MENAPDLLITTKNAKNNFRGSYSVDDILGPTRALLVGSASVSRPANQSYNGKVLKRVIETPGLDLGYSPHYAVAKRQWDELVLNELEKKDQEAAKQSEEGKEPSSNASKVPEKAIKRGNFDALRNLMNVDLGEVEQTAPTWSQPSPYPYKGHAFFEEEEEEEGEGEDDSGDYDISFSSEEEEEEQVIEGPTEITEAGTASTALKLVELSSTEKDMDGAPQGPLYQVEAVSFEVLTPIIQADFLSLGEGEQEVPMVKQIEGQGTAAVALRCIVSVLFQPTSEKKETPWHLMFGAVNLVRKMLKFHLPAMLTLLLKQQRRADNLKELPGLNQYEDLLTGIVVGVTKAVKNLRSVLAKNAAMCCAELLLAAHEKEEEAALPLMGSDATLITSALLEVLVPSNPKALRSAATLGLDMALSSDLPLSLLCSIISAASSFSKHPSSSVNEASMHYSSIVFNMVLSKLMDANYFTLEINHAIQTPNKAVYYAKNKECLSSSMNLIDVLRSISFGLNGKSAQGKAAARRCCIVLKQLLGEEEYEFSVNDIDDITKLKKEELIEASQDKVVDKPEKSTDKRSGLTQLMKQKRKEAKSIPKSEESSIDDLPPPPPQSTSTCDPTSTTAASSLKLVELSSTEKDMDGAPQGPLYQVEAVSFEVLTPIIQADFLSPGEGEQEVPMVKQIEGQGTAAVALRCIVSVLFQPISEKKETPWHLMFGAVNLVRKMLKFHLPAMLTLLLEDLLTGIVVGVTKAVKNLRSVLAKNAAMCCAELLLAAHEKEEEAALPLMGSDATLITSALLEVLVPSNPKALRSAAILGLDMALSSDLPLSLLCSIISAASSFSKHPSSSVNEASMHYSSIVFNMVLSKLMDANYFTLEINHAIQTPNKTVYYAKNKECLSSSMNLIDVLRSISFGLNGKSAQGKAAARRCCIVLKQLLGEEEYEFSVNDIDDINQLKKEELIEASQDKVVDKPEKSTDKRSELAQLMKQKRKEAKGNDTKLISGSRDTLLKDDDGSRTEDSHTSSPSSSLDRQTPPSNRNDRKELNTKKKGGGGGGWSLFGRGKKQQENGFNIELSDDDVQEEDKVQSKASRSSKASKSKTSPVRGSRQGTRSGLHSSTVSSSSRNKATNQARRIQSTNTVIKSSPTSSAIHNNRVSPSLRHRNNTSSSSSSSLLSNSLGKPTTIPVRTSSAGKQKVTSSNNSVGKRGAAQDRALLLRQRRGTAQSVDSVTSPSKKTGLLRAPLRSPLRSGNRTSSSTSSSIMSSQGLLNSITPTSRNGSGNSGPSPIRRKVTSSSSSNSGGSSNSLRGSKTRPKPTVERRPSRPSV